MRVDSSVFPFAFGGLNIKSRIKLTPFLTRGFRRVPSRRRHAFRPPPWVAGEGSGRSRGCPRTVRGWARWPGGSRDKTAHSCHVLSGWRVGRQKARKRHSQTLNIDLSLPDRDGELGFAQGQTPSSPSYSPSSPNCSPATPPPPSPPPQPPAAHGPDAQGPSGDHWSPPQQQQLLPPWRRRRTVRIRKERA